MEDAARKVYRDTLKNELCMLLVHKAVMQTFISNHLEKDLVFIARTKTTVLQTWAVCSAGFRVQIPKLLGLIFLNLIQSCMRFKPSQFNNIVHMRDIPVGKDNSLEKTIKHVFCLSPTNDRYRLFIDIVLGNQ